MPHPFDENAAYMRTNIRIIPELRSVHVERETLQTPRTTLYFNHMYDLSSTPPRTFTKCTFRLAAQTLFKSDASVLEIPEPLWVRFLPKNICLVAVWRVGGWLKRRPRKVVAYAIENNDLATLLKPGRLGRLLARPFSFALGIWMRANIQKIAYGSDGALATYCSLPFVETIPHRKFLELPKAIHPLGISGENNIEARALFIGELAERKGISDLMRAWELVEQQDSTVKLVIVGGGPFEEVVDSWVAAKPSQRRFLGKILHEDIENELAFSTVLVAPSKRWGRWREQIGLPIKEALSHGLTIVTTAETGLAHWLQLNGHHVLVEPTPEKLSRTIQHALANPLERKCVGEGLPQHDNRIVADSWLYSRKPETR